MGMPPPPPHTARGARIPLIATAAAAPPRPPPAAPSATPACVRAHVALAAQALAAPGACDPWASNDRMEFLGDCVLKMLAGTYMYLRER